MAPGPPQKHEDNPRDVLLACGFLCLLALGCAVWWAYAGVSSLWTNARLREIPCRILSREMVARTYNMSRGGTTTTRFPEIEFAYEVNGAAYSSREPSVWGGSDSFGWGDGLQSRSPDELYEKYPPGSGATCWHDPADPSRAYLLKTVSFYWFINGFIIFGCVAYALCGMLWARRRLRAANACQARDAR